MQPVPLRYTLFSTANRQTSFNADFVAKFENFDVEKAAHLLTRASAAQWIDLGAWVSSPPLVARKVQFVHEAIKSMSHGWETAAKALLQILEELKEDRADHEHAPAALEYILQASTHARWVNMLLLRPNLLSRYCALLGNGSDAAFAFCFLGAQMARSEETSVHAWQIWELAVRTLDDATRLEVTTNMNAVDRPSFSWQKNRQYRTLWPELYDKPGFRTKLPIYIFVFPGKTLQEEAANRDLALQIFLHNASQLLGRPATLDDFKGIRADWTSTGRATVEVNYSIRLADCVRYYLGFGQDADNKQGWTKEPNFLSVVDQVRDEFEKIWLTAIDLSSPLPALETGTPIYHQVASREQYAAVLNQLSEHNLLIGELHDHFAALNFIIQNMAWLRERGYATVYLENLPAEAQRLANAYFSGLSGTPMSPELKMAAMELATVLEKAKEVGMRVMFVDTDMVSPDSLGSNGMNYRARAAALNAFAVGIINDDMPRRANGKFIALFGIFHVWRDTSGVADVFGVQCALPNCKSMFMFDIPQRGTTNSHDETFFIVSHDQKDKVSSSEQPLIFRVMADVYVGSRMPLRMSVKNNESGVANRGVKPLELPPPPSMK